MYAQHPGIHLLIEDATWLLLIDCPTEIAMETRNEGQRCDNFTTEGSRDQERTKELKWPGKIEEVRKIESVKTSTCTNKSRSDIPS